MEKYLKQLNEEQLKPVLDTEGAVLVTAGAGSGKTRVLTSRIAYLIKEKKVYPYNILAITFTNKAANEMQARLSAMVDNAADIWICTIHKMCVRILRQSGHAIGYDSRFTIYSDAERQRVIKQIFKRFNIENDKILRNVKYHIDRAKMLGLSCGEYIEQNADEKYIIDLQRVYLEYERELKSANALDFDDLLIKTYELLATKRDWRDYYAGKFRYIHVDEFQDTNTLQYKIIKLLTVRHGNIFAVGDDDQSIYGWRGAQIENILNFEKDFAGASIYKLERNYRSTKNILDTANYVIKNNSFRREKRLWTEGGNGSEVECFEAENENSEAMYTADIIKSRIARGAKASDFAVLMRLNALSRAYEQEFARRNIKLRIFGGQKFFDRKEIKDLTAYLRIINNPSDNDAFLRIINVPKRGIGEKTVESLIDGARKQNQTLYDILLDGSYLLPAGVAKKIEDFKEMITDFVLASQEMRISELVKKIIKDTRFLDMFEAPGEDNQSRKANINELLSSVEDFQRQYPDAGLSEYLNTVTLSSDSDGEDAADCVTVATIHAVKGLEFDTVFICGLDDGIMPIERSGQTGDDLEEERRLMYVAVTRAKNHLYLTRAKSRFLYGERRPTVRSRFLNELSGIVNVPQNAYPYSGRQNYSDDFFNTRTNVTFAAQKTYEQGGRTYNSAPVYNRDIAPSTGVANLTGAFNRTRAETNRAQDTAAFKPGSKVEHAKFGEGTIILVRGTGAKAIADIAFKSCGVKQLSLAVAPLKKLS